jgi:ABC transporter substrate binding protein
MRRREFIAALGSAVVWPLLARAQLTRKMWRIGVLGGAPRPILVENYSGFQQRMRELGYFEGRDFVSELRAADNSYDRLAVELVALNVDILLTATTAAVRPLQEATRTIPIIFAGIPNPVGLGFVASLGRPGGNTTGLANFFVDTAPKQLGRTPSDPRGRKGLVAQSAPTYRRRNGSGAFSLARCDPLRNAGDAVASQASARPPSCHCAEATPMSARLPLGFARPV